MLQIRKTEEKSELKFREWDNIVESIAEAFRMNEEERQWLQNKNLAKLIAAIPYLAECEDPGRTAITHLGAYILSLRIKTLANCQKSDDSYLYRRLEMINHFIGGDREIIKKGMNLIALNMISDYARDVEEDRAFGKYNPIDSGAINFDEEKERLISQIEQVKCEEMDDLMTTDASINAFWT